MLRTIKCQFKLHNDRYLLPRYTNVYSDLRHFTSLLAPNGASAMDGSRGWGKWLTFHNGAIKATVPSNLSDRDIGSE
jgi:hypothetical protein